LKPINFDVTEHIYSGVIDTQVGNSLAHEAQKAGFQVLDRAMKYSETYDCFYIDGEAYRKLKENFGLV